MPERKVKRNYESPARTAAAQATRRKIRDTAARLFVDRGYEPTSMKSIAAAAGVSERTVFLVFPTKAALLGECIRVAVRGDDEATPLLARKGVRAVLEAPPQRMIALLADASADLLERAAPLLTAGESVGIEDPVLDETREHGRAATPAAPPARAPPLRPAGEWVGMEAPVLDETREHGRAATRSDMLEIATAMKRAGVLKRGMSAEHAADIMYALAASESVYLRLVDHRGWSTAAYARALETALGGALQQQ